MLGLSSRSKPPLPIPIINQTKCIPLRFHPQQNLKFPISSLRKSLEVWRPKASENGGREKVLESSEQGGKKEDGGGGGPRFNLKWFDLFLDPDPDNIVAVGLTGLLAWASVQVLWQLFLISSAILAAAIKYSFIAALLIFILITLL